MKLPVNEIWASEIRTQWKGVYIFIYISDQFLSERWIAEKYPLKSLAKSELYLDFNQSL